MRIRTLIVAILLSSSVAAGAQQTLWPDAVSTPKSAAAPVASLVDGLAARLHENPDDAGGWLLLAKSYEYLGDPAEARDAYARAVALGISDIEFEAKLNETWLSDASRRNSRDDLR